MFIAFDFETTGFSPIKNEIIEIGAAKIDDDGNVLEVFQEFIKPNKMPEKEIYDLTKIEESQLLGAQKADVVLPKFEKFISGSDLIAHNSKFDSSFLICEFKKNKINLENLIVCDSIVLTDFYGGILKNRKLGNLVNHFGLEQRDSHRALDDALSVVDLIKHFMKKRNITMEQIKKASAPTKLSTMTKYYQQTPMEIAGYLHNNCFVKYSDEGESSEEFGIPRFVFLDKNGKKRICAIKEDGTTFDFSLSGSIVERK